MTGLRRAASTRCVIKKVCSACICTAYLSVQTKLWDTKLWDSATLIHNGLEWSGCREAVHCIRSGTMTIRSGNQACSRYPSHFLDVVQPMLSVSINYNYLLNDSIYLLAYCSQRTCESVLRALYLVFRVLVVCTRTKRDRSWIECCVLLISVRCDMAQNSTRVTVCLKFSSLLVGR